MKFKIVETPEELLKSTSAIPFHYCGSLSSFAKPKFMSSLLIDILYQRVVIKGCILRNMTLYVRQPITLLTSDHNAMVSINCVIKGNVEVRLNGEESISLAQNEYAILQMNTDDHALILQPGIHEILRFDYTNRIIQKEIPEWVEKLEKNESVVYEDGVISEDLIKRLQQLKHTTIDSPEQEEWFYRKLRKYLRLVLEEHHFLKD